MDNCPLLAARKKCAFQISWNGNDACFQKHEKTLLAALGNGELVWKRHEKPIQAKFDLKLVPFADDLITQLEEVSFCESIAFVHLFFVNVSHQDEYRSQVRHRISEWFSSLNTANNTHWLIIFDSSKAKERKNRGAVLERIKSDFAKHQERLVEVCDSTPSTSTDLQNRLSSCFLASLDKFLANYERSYAHLKGNWEQDDWNLSVFVNQQFQLCRFYWNLGLYDCVLGELDKIDVLINEIVHNSTDRPLWVQTLVSQSFGSTCPLLRLLIHVEGVAENVSLIEIRTFILANQILSLFYIYYHRRAKATSPTSPRSTESMQQMLANDFATIMLRYAHACTQKVAGETTELEIKHDPLIFQTWNVLLATDVLELCVYFVELEQLSHGTGFLCQLICLKCTNLDALTYADNATSRQALASWLQGAVGQRNADVLGLKTAETLNILRRTFLDRAALAGSPEQGKTVEQLYELALIESIELLRHYGWHKAADGFCKNLLDLYRDSADTEHSRTTFMRLLLNMFENCRVLPLLVHYCRLGAEEFPDELQKDSELWFNVIFVLVMNGDSEAEKEKYARMLLAEATKDKVCINRYNFDFKIPMTFPFEIARIPNNFIATLLNAPTKFTLTLVNRFGFAIPHCVVRAVFKRLSKNAIEPINPVFHCPITPENTVARCAAVVRGLSGRDSAPAEFLYQSIEKVDDEVPEFLATSSPNGLQSKNLVLVPDTNELTFECIANPVGCFVLNHLEIAIGNSLVFYVHQQQEMANRLNLDNVYCSVDVRKPSVFKKDCSEPLLAGVVQKISLVVQAGTMPLTQASQLRLFNKSDNNTMEFLSSNGEWKPVLHVNVPKLESQETHTLDVYLCLAIDQMHFSAEDSLIVTRQIGVEWLEDLSLFDLRFQPVMSFKMSSTIVEQKVLFSLVVNRTDALNVLDVDVKDVELLQYPGIAKPPVPAKLINRKIKPIVANSTVKIVWDLPLPRVDKSVPVKHSLNLRYLLKANSAGASASLPSTAFNREYAFAWKEDITINKADYDICAQIVADSMQLCRLDVECSLIVSLRLVSTHVEPRVVATVDADPDFWTVTKKWAVVYMKESGVGQVTFSIVPRQIGMLPYPSVYIHRCNTDFNEKEHSLEAFALGERLNSYHRLQARQVRVLAAKQNTDDALSTGNTSTTGSIRLAIKERSFGRLKKLIDRDKSNAT